MSVKAPAILFAMVLALPAVLWAQPKTPKKLTEAEILKLVELQIDDDAIIHRIRRSDGAGFELTDEIEKRLRTAGASDGVLAALRPQAGEKIPDLADDPERESIAVWADQQYNNDSPLVSELRINGTLVEDFSSTSQRPAGKHIKMGWNTITLKTRVRPEVKKLNYLDFNIGPTHKDPDTGKMVMSPVLWSFNNRTDWSEKNGTMVHRLGPDVKDVTLTFHVLYAGSGKKDRELKDGDFILQHRQDYDGTPMVTSTVFVNGRPLTTFLGRDRNQATITPYLKKGKNEIRLISNRVPNALENNYVEFNIGGPAEYNATQRKYEMKPILKFRSTDGWVQDRKTGQWRVDAADGGDRLERTLTFQLDEVPKAK
jgi:hypothetical protein